MTSQRILAQMQAPSPNFHGCWTVHVPLRREPLRQWCWQGLWTNKLLRTSGNRSISRKESVCRRAPRSSSSWFFRWDPEKWGKGKPSTWKSSTSRRWWRREDSMRGRRSVYPIRRSKQSTHEYTKIERPGCERLPAQEPRCDRNRIGKILTDHRQREDSSYCCCARKCEKTE